MENKNFMVPEGRRVGNVEVNQKKSLGRAQSKCRLDKYHAARVVVMNHIDHPNGGEEGSAQLVENNLQRFILYLEEVEKKGEI